MDNPESDRQKEWYNAREKEALERTQKLVEYAGKISFAILATVVVAVLGTCMFLIVYGAMSVMTDLAK